MYVCYWFCFNCRNLFYAAQSWDVGERGGMLLSALGDCWDWIATFQSLSNHFRLKGMWMNTRTSFQWGVTGRCSETTRSDKVTATPTCVSRMNRLWESRCEFLTSAGHNISEPYSDIKYLRVDWVQHVFVVYTVWVWKLEPGYMANYRSNQS